MKSLKLKKVKISRINNLHTLFGGADTVGTANQQAVSFDINCYKTKDLNDSDCTPGTNGGTTLGRTGAAPRDPNGVEN